MKITVGFCGHWRDGEIHDSPFAKYNVVVYNRTKERALDLLEEGAIWADTPTEVESIGCGFLTIVGYPKDVEEVYW